MKSHKQHTAGTPDYSFLFNNAEQGMICFNHKGIITSANPEAGAILGVNLDQLIGKATDALKFSSTGAEKITLAGNSHPVIQAIMSNQDIGPLTVSIYNPEQKQEKILSIKALPQCAAGENKPSRAYLLLSDVTKIKQAEQEFEQPEMNKNQASSKTKEIVLYCDSEMRIIWSNEAAKTIMEGRSQEPRGTFCHEIFKREGMECNQCPAKKALESGKYEDEVIEFKDGSIHHIRAHPIMIENQGQTNVLQINQDITSRINCEVDLMRAKEKAESANKAKSRFLANMSHEIRTPMNVIVGMADLLYRSELENEYKEYAGMIKDSANSLLSIINEILDFSKIEADRIELNFSPFELTEHIESTIASFRQNAEYKNITLTFNLDPDLPQYFAGDILRINQVLTNLIANAIKYTVQGTVDVSVAIAEPLLTQESSDQLNNDFYFVKFTVSDSGIGIPREKQSLLFDSFTKLENKNIENHQGTGLGLTISKRLVELMGGEIWFESESGKGSNFIFTIPLKKYYGEPAVQTNSVNTPDGKEITEKPLKLLLAEDKPMNQKLTTTLLNKMDHEVDIAQNGEEAVHMTAAKNYDALLMDINMPEMDGVEATRIIREREQNEGTERLPIIALTAYAIKGDREKYLSAGMDHYIAKPITTSALKTGLAQAVYPKNREETVSPDQAKDPAPIDNNFELEAIMARFDGNLDLVKELVGLFLEDYHQEIVKADRAMTEADRESLQSIIHGLKGETGNLGLDSAHKIAVELDQKLKKEFDDTVQPLYAQFKEEIEKLEGHFSQYNKND